MLIEHKITKEQVWLRGGYQMPQGWKKCGVLIPQAMSADEIRETELRIIEQRLCEHPHFWLAIKRMKHGDDYNAPIHHFEPDDGFVGNE